MRLDDSEKHAEHVAPLRLATLQTDSSKSLSDHVAAAEDGDAEIEGLEA